MEHPPEPRLPVGSVVDLQAALDALGAAVEAVVAHGADAWARLNQYDRTHAAKRMEASRKKLSLADAAFITAHEDAMSDIPARRVRLISRILNITRCEAKVRLAAATRVSGRPDPWAADPGAPGPDYMPYLADAVATGDADCTAVEKVDRQIRALPASVQADITAAADEPCATLVRTQGPDSLDSLRNFLLDLAGAEETYTDKDHQRLRSFTVGRRGIDGMTPERGLLTPEAAATLTRLMIDHASTGSLCDGRDEANEDTRTPDQRRHDVLLAGYGPDKPLATGRGATTIVTVMGIDQLSSGRGTALTDVGVHVPVSTLVKDPESITGCLQIQGFEGRTLFFGRTRRLGSLDQYLALVGEEGMSSAPGSDSPPAASLMHHIVGGVSRGQDRSGQLHLRRSPTACVGGRHTDRP